MKLDKIRQGLQHFKDYMHTDAAYETLFLYEGIQAFQNNWDTTGQELSKMYLDATTNKSSMRMWRRNDAHPRKVMSAFFHFEPVYTKFMFKDLFAEEIAVDSRLERFVFHADQLYEQLNSHFIDGPYNSHFHDRTTASIYLAYHKPQEYLIYNWDLFAAFIPYLEMNNPPHHEDCARYYKVCHTLSKFILDEELIHLHKLRLKPTQHHTETSMTLVYEFMHFISRHPLF